MPTSAALAGAAPAPLGCEAARRSWAVSSISRRGVRDHPIPPRQQGPLLARRARAPRSLEVDATARPTVPSAFPAGASPGGAAPASAILPGPCARPARPGSGSRLFINPHSTLVREAQRPGRGGLGAARSRHSPDRLARKYAWQVLLVEELQRAGVGLVFLNRTIGISPEEDLLLQMQGMIAEYERAKIMGLGSRRSRLPRRPRSERTASAPGGRRDVASTLADAGRAGDTL